LDWLISNFQAIWPEKTMLELGKNSAQVLDKILLVLTRSSNSRWKASIFRETAKRTVISVKIKEGS